MLYIAYATYSIYVGCNMLFVVDFFREADGTKPVAQFIRSLPVKLRAKVVADLHLLEEYGNKAKDCKEREEREMSDLSELTSELMQDKEFRKEYEDLQPEMNIMRAMMDARIRAGMTQMELSQKSGISQADISRLENGTRNPSIALLKRLADAMDTTLIIEFVPKRMEI